MIGQLFFNQSAAAGSNLYACTAANSWTVIGGSTGGGQPQVSFSSPGIAFGSQNIGTTSGVQTVTLTNLGVSLLDITSMQTTGSNASDFAAASTCGSIVASGASCTINVTFTPSVSGAETGSLVFNDNQTGSPQTLTLTGTGVAPVSAGGLVITPSAEVANVGQSITFTSNRPVNWALVQGSSGALVTNSSTSATYTAPASIPTQNALAGCPVLPDDAIFNVRIDNLPLNANSAAWTANAAPNIGLSFDTSWGTSIGDNTMPLTDESFYYTATANGPWLIPPVPYLKRENGDYVGRGNNQDHHVLAVNRNTCQFYETYNNFLTPAPCTNPAQTCTATSGWGYNSTSYVLPSNGSTDAASLPIAPLTLHLDEIKAGAVRHPLRFTLAQGYIQTGNPLWPAFGTNGWGGPNVPPYGARFRLKASYNISAFSPAAQVILTGLKQYGMMLADVGSGPSAQANTDVTRDPTVMAALNQIAGAGLSLSNFEVVDESNLMVSATSSQVNPGNGYVAPVMYAGITATDQSNSNYEASYTVPLQGVNIGLYAPTMTIMAGLPGYQLSWWVNGSNNQNVTWSLISGPGAVTSGGIYTPPASVSAPANAVLLGTSAADPNATENLYVTIIPSGANPAGSIRVDSGGKGVTDGNGNVWLADVGYESGNYVQLNSDAPAWPAATNPEIAVYQSGGYTYGTDLAYYFVVPNGNYKVRLMFGQPYNGASPSGCSPFNSHWHAPLDLETQGQTQIHNFDFGLPINYQCATPVDEFLPATVSNNSLEIALRAVVPEGVNFTPGPLLNGLEIIPDSTAPYLAIDSQQQTSVNAGSTLQLYSVGWYMSNSATWSLSGVGTISANGLYTAPATAPVTAQSVVITATSTVNPSVTANVTLTVP